MLFEYRSGAIYLDNQLRSPDHSFYLTPSGNGLYKDISYVDLERPDQQYVYVDLPNRQIVVNSSWYGEYPLFYFIQPDYCAVSDRFDQLYECISASTWKMQLDRTAIFESMIFDNLLRDRTYVKGVKKIIAGKRISIDIPSAEITQQSKFILPFHQGNPVPSNNSLLDGAVDLLRHLLDTFSFEGSRTLLPLSGGFDSRLLACLLLQEGVSFDSMVFGPSEGSERFVANRVGKALGIHVKNVELKNDFYKSYGDLVTLMTGGLSNHRHCHMYASMHSSQASYDLIVHGYLGGEYAGIDQPSVAQDFNLSEEDAMEAFLAKKVYSTRIWHLLSSEERDEIRADITDIAVDNNSVNLPCHLEEYWHNVDRQFSLTANVFAPIEEFGTVIRPFANYEYATFFNALPFSLREGRNLFKTAASVISPIAFGFGNQDQFYSVDSMRGKIEGTAFEVYKRIVYGALWASNGKIALPNPKAIERHRELLASTLKRSLEESVRDMSEILDKDLQFLRGVRLGNRQELSSQYRILGIHTLLQAWNLS